MTSHSTGATRDVAPLTIMRGQRSDSHLDAMQEAAAVLHRHSMHCELSTLQGSLHIRGGCHIVGECELLPTYPPYLTSCKPYTLSANATVNHVISRSREVSGTNPGADLTQQQWQGTITSTRCCHQPCIVAVHGSVAWESHLKVQ